MAKATLLFLILTIVTATFGEYEGNIRLVDGTSALNGRVEVFHDQQWGTVCDDFWSSNDAVVVCRQLGYTTAKRAVSNAYFGEGPAYQPIHLDDVLCDGTESRLTDCRHNGWGDENCEHDEDAGVECTNQYMETESSDGFSHWDTVGRALGAAFGFCLSFICMCCFCSRKTQTSATTRSPQATIVFRVSGDSVHSPSTPTAVSSLVSSYADPPPSYADLLPSYESVMSSSTVFNGEGALEAQQTFVYAAPSTGTNRSRQPNGGSRELSENHWMDGRGPHPVNFDFFRLDPLEGNIRLANGTSELNGRVEIFHDQQWGTVCDNFWNFKDAVVVCRQLGYNTAERAVGSAYFGEGPAHLPIHMVDVLCDGAELRLIDCWHNGGEVDNCGHDEDAGVECTNQDPPPSYGEPPPSYVEPPPSYEWVMSSTVCNGGDSLDVAQQTSYAAPSAATNIPS
ncbi:scavenger receptor cysteine-rich domain-containing group B protein-like [Diadema antillarum]|uniref:scavenger receptor cysteine-rich domain-containing group B protein-like n=1 Tax=Diadema antillarum TaxID=105358 RepID=UPI003A83F4F4